MYFGGWPGVVVPRDLVVHYRTLSDSPNISWVKKLVEPKAQRREDEVNNAVQY